VSQVFPMGDSAFCIGGLGSLGALVLRVLGGAWQWVLVLVLGVASGSRWRTR